MPTSIASLDVTQYVRINTAYNPLILQAHRDAVRIAVSELQPALSNEAFHLLDGGDPPLPINSPDTNVWVLAQTDTSSLIITENTDIPVTVNNVVDVSETDLTYETDMVTQLCEISRKLSILIKHSEIITEMDLGE